MLLVLVLLVVTLVQTAQAFYNPSTGRWLSRDPIEEQGGQSLYLFVNNNPVVVTDWLGLVGMGEYRMCCMGEVWNPKTHCCDGKGQVIPNAPKATGVVTHSWRQNKHGGGPVHWWLTWSGGSADSNGDAHIFTPGSKKFPLQRPTPQRPAKIPH